MLIYTPPNESGLQTPRSRVGILVGPTIAGVHLAALSEKHLRIV